MTLPYDPDDITRTLGLPRPFESYAPRTQRRYRAAYQAGLTAREANKREYRQRQRQPAERAKRAATRLRKMGMNAGGSHDRDNIDRLGEAVGWEEAARILEDQADAVSDYKQSRNTSSGRRNWDNRGNAEITGDDFIDLTPYFYYRAAA